MAGPRGTQYSPGVGSENSPPPGLTFAQPATMVTSTGAFAVATERWLIIVRRDQEDLHVRLAAQYPEAEVVLDRRQPERRQPLTPTEQEIWDQFGYRLVHRSG